MTLLVAGGVCEVLVLTTFDLDEYVDAALLAGAAGYLLKTVTAARLVEAVRAVAAGDGVLAPEVTRRVLARLVGIARTGDARPIGRGANGLETLTAREHEVLGRLGQGLSNADIAARLAITEATVKTHVSRILTKLDLRSRTQAAVLAQRAGIT